MVSTSIERPQMAHGQGQAPTPTSICFGGLRLLPPTPTSSANCSWKTEDIWSALGGSFSCDYEQMSWLEMSAEAETGSAPEFVLISREENKSWEEVRRASRRERPARGGALFLCLALL